jgi:coniferyl-aldehyde dehydrogenase
VVGVIVPWNFPLNLSLVPLTYIFAAGNRAMVKMSENSRHLARLLIDKMPAYFPPEKLQFFDETGGVGVEFSKLPFDHLLFTGSGTTGRAVMAAAAQNLCPVTLELGGKAPAIVCDDFPLAGGRAHPVRQVPQRRPDLHHGRPCLAAAKDKHRAPSSSWRKDRAGALPQPGFARLHQHHRPRAFERLLQALDDARARGAAVLPLLPGPAFDEARARSRRTSCSTPRPIALLMQREIFGPILPLLAYRGSTRWCAINAGPRPAGHLPLQQRRGRRCRCCWTA